ncbi:MAG TPA: Mur ligase family protein, partial [Candidatus Goldiibacteriota bacterium]|nr:Mur ligase family protein [Candidatus Goldiibacteriota bacterium]
PSEKAFLESLNKLNEFKFDFRLSRIKKALKLLKRPQDSFYCVHVAGSNGKGSVASFIASILKEHGLKTGLYTSPHLKHPRERISINGSHIDGRLMAGEGFKLLSFLRRRKIRLTYFEFMTVLCMVIFRKAGVEAAVMEAGLGGRYDATNVDYGRKLLSVITSVSLEHTQYLGNTEAGILEEKRRIVRNEPVVYNCMAPSLARMMKHEYGRRAFYAADICGVGETRIFKEGLYALVLLKDRNLLLKPLWPSQYRLKT